MKSIPQDNSLAISFFTIPNELLLKTLTYLRAFDLASLQQTCRFFNERDLITSVIYHTANFVYPPELTTGFDSAIVGGEVSTKQSLTYESMRNMEMLVVVRVLSRPEPPLRESGYYVSKAWCKTALKWLEVQMDKGTHTPHQSPHKKGGTPKKSPKLSKKQQRLRDRKISDASPPWPNVNHDIVCEHGDLRHCGSKAARARRRVMDKQAWKVIRKLYPDSVQLSSIKTGCLQCALEAETAKKTAEDKKEREKLKRQQPLNNPVVRKFYSRNKGVPMHCLRQGNSGGYCPLVMGVYHALPREWCHRWRKYIRTGEGERPYAPDAANLLCDAHRLPLVPPHLEDFLYGETLTLLGVGPDTQMDPNTTTPSPASNIHTLNTTTTEDNAMLLSSGIISSPAEIELQRLAMLHISPRQTPLRRINSNSHLDRENQVVVEILTDEELSALQQWWPEIHSSFVLSFAVVEDDITWSTPPCRDCDAGHPDASLKIRNRRKRWLKKVAKK